MDDFDRFWQWANKPLDSGLTIPGDIHHAVTSLPPEARRDRAKVNEAVRMVRETAGGNTALHRPQIQISRAGDRCTNTNNSPRQCGDRPGILGTIVRDGQN